MSNRAKTIINTINLRRTYDIGSEEVVAVDDVNLTVRPGQFMAVVGRSGSGKTTLLNLMAGLDKATSGTVLFEEQDLSTMSERQLTEIRRHKIGFVFQSFGLLPLLSAFENVELPLRISGYPLRKREDRTKEALEIVGLLGRAQHRPYELSGGEQQRIAIARAIVTQPPVILADEPTGELDSTNAQAIFGLFKQMVETQGISVVAATHDSTLLALADVLCEMRDGKIIALTEDTSSYLRRHEVLRLGSEGRTYQSREAGPTPEADKASPSTEGEPDTPVEQEEEHFARFRRPADTAKTRDDDTGSTQPQT